MYIIPQEEIDKNPTYVECVLKPYDNLVYIICLEGENVLQHLSSFFSFREEDLESVILPSILDEYFKNRNCRCRVKIRLYNIFSNPLGSLWIKANILFINLLYKNGYASKIKELEKFMDDRKNS